MELSGLVVNIEHWATNNSNSILAGIISSIIVVLLQSVVTGISLAVASFLALKWRLRLIWRIKNPSPTFVLSGSISHVSDEIRSVILAGPDADAASKVLATLGLLYPSCRIRHSYSSSFPEELYTENVICVGGPINNKGTNLYLSRISGVEFLEYAIKDSSGNIYETSYDEDGKAQEDYGLILRTQNPFDQNSVIMVVAGCDTYGVLAAAISVSPDNAAKNVRKAISKKLGLLKYFCPINFAAIVKCSVLDNDVGKLELIKIWRI